MTLNQKQAEFALCVAQLIIWAHKHGVPVIGAEWHRPPELAAIYAEQGKGIRNSLHTKKLALDLFAVDPATGSVTWNAEPYAKLGAKWKTMHPLARWGGDFAGRDAVHFSFEHGGVR